MLFLFLIFFSQGPTRQRKGELGQWVFIINSYSHTALGAFRLSECNSYSRVSKFRGITVVSVEQPLLARFSKLNLTTRDNERLFGVLKISRQI